MNGSKATEIEILKKRVYTRIFRMNIVLSLLGLLNYSNKDWDYTILMNWMEAFRPRTKEFGKDIGCGPIQMKLEQFRLNSVVQFPCR